ncbi:MAG: acetyltransferase [Verrucomicrobiae bacterium]|nr:acetyltransferase [Verrucomicrobiae bacterium]MCB1235248.1 acetyltransferase [Verrucomicrobiae bacterium]MCP5540641.1 acetyltransferase [Akkermansiaceae bacterium]
MTKKPVVIFGCGEIAQLAQYYFDTDSDYEVAGFTVDAEYLKADSFLDLPAVPFESVEERFPPGDFEMFVAVSYAKINQVRQKKADEAGAKGYRLASYISSRASVLTREPIGENAFILEDNTIQPFAHIGRNVTLWSGNHIGHHSRIGDHCFISSHVVISGGAIVEPYCFLGVNCTIRDHITIGASSVIGAGALVMADAEPASVFVAAATEKSKIPSHRLRGI